MPIGVLGSPGGSSRDSHLVGGALRAYVGVKTRPVTECLAQGRE